MFLQKPIFICQRVPDDYMGNGSYLIRLILKVKFGYDLQGHATMFSTISKVMPPCFLRSPRSCHHVFYDLQGHATMFSTISKVMPPCFLAVRHWRVTVTQSFLMVKGLVIKWETPHYHEANLWKAYRMKLVFSRIFKEIRF